ncbi:MAG: hypothetical protein JSS76_04845 [Bacteroidetes bacterium]|nr:hypothetical protein [Bacteroidota bacterium]
MRAIISILLWASILAALALLSSCSKRNSHTFNLYFYTTNATMPKVYVIQNGKNMGQVPVLESDPAGVDSAQQLMISTRDASTEIDLADAQGHVVEMITYKFHDDGSYKEGGGGYLLYDTWQKQPYNLLLRMNGQFKL